MDFVESIVNDITGLLWGPFMLILLIGGGLFLSFKIKFIQFRHFGYIWSQTFGSLIKKGKKDKESEGTISAFQAVTAELGSTVGASNIIGISVAIFFGGPGALFWMWVTAFVGMATKYSEIVLSILYREKDVKEEFIGGPMYYLKKGLKSPFLANAFAFFFMIEIFSSIMVQANSASGSAASVGIPTAVSGLIIAFFIGIIVIGGVKRVGKVSEKFVPFMSGLYLLGCLVIILANVPKLPMIFGLIFKSAFSAHAAAGGFAGSTVMIALRWGMARGLYSNEAGMGSAPIAHAAAKTDHPTRQGFWGIISVFFDTVVIGSFTGLVIIASGIWKKPNLEPSAMPATAFNDFYGDLGGTIVSLSLLLFVISTIYVITFYGERIAFFLFGYKFSLFMRGLYIAACFIGAIGGLKFLWLFLDLLLALVVIPNIIGVIYLSPEVAVKTKEFFTSPLYYLKDKKRSSK
jgi:alanine or glycine:cation symporter, AGCS family